METILNDKKFIRASVVLIILLSVFVALLSINEIKASQYIGRGNTPVNTISVTGKGEVVAISDIATLNVNLTKEALTSKEAQSLLNSSITKTLNYLKSKSINDKDIKSEYGGITPKYSYGQINCLVYPCPQPDAKIVGYTATESITIKVREVDSANDIRTGLASLGITDISGPTFSIDNENSLKDQARSLAIKDARNHAEILARDLGVSLISVATFSDSTDGYPMMYAKGAVLDSVSSVAPAPVLPKGENKITSNVTITYEIK